MVDVRLPVRMAHALAVLVSLVLAGCGGATLSPSSPSQSGTLANAAITGDTKPAKRFNPFDDTEGAATGRREIIERPTMEQVLQTAGLPEMSLGRPDAPVTVVMFASMTCPFCRQFMATTFPSLKARYIDTGKVRFILREFPIGFQSGAATIALRCVAPEKYFATYETLMNLQAKWVSQEVRREPIWQIVRKFGLTRDAFDRCYQDKALIANLDAVKQRGRTLGVIGTPNFFVGTKLYKRVLTMTDFDQIIAGGATAAAQ